LMNGIYKEWNSNGNDRVQISFVDGIRV
jgi:hypothetical protein